MYRLVNAISCKIIDSVCELFMGRSRLSSYLGHLDLLSPVYQLVNTVTCEIIDPASPNSVVGSLWEGL